MQKSQLIQFNNLPQEELTVLEMVPEVQPMNSNFILINSHRLHHHTKMRMDKITIQSNIKMRES